MYAFLLAHKQELELMKQDQYTSILTLALGTCCLSFRLLSSKSLDLESVDMDLSHILSVEDCI